MRTTPGDAETLQHSPAEVTLTFGEAVGTGLGAMKVLSDQGSRVDTGQISQTDGESKVHLALKPVLPEGTYVVVWRVVSGDSHPVAGAFSFSVGKPSLDFFDVQRDHPIPYYCARGWTFVHFRCGLQPTVSRSDADSRWSGAACVG